MRTDITHILKTIYQNWNRKHWWIQQFNTQVASQYYRWTNHNAGDSVAEQDWDNLILLDACRFDLFEQKINKLSISGELEKKASLGTTSAEFLRRNFDTGADFKDIVYVTANPHVETDLDDGIFHAVDHVWRDGWDESTGTVLPETMVERTLKAQSKCPNKRIISHWMQPHRPFIGDYQINTDSGIDGARQRALDIEPDRGKRSVWAKMRSGTVEVEEAWKAYESNLQATIEPVEHLVTELDGLSIISADHGEAFGERVSPFPTTVYGHLSGVRIPSLVDVPWFRCDYEYRKDVESEQSVSQSEPDSDPEMIEDRLEALGYK